MKGTFLLDGYELKTSAKGNLYANLYVKELRADGTPALKQETYSCFNETAVKELENFQAGDIIELDLRISQASVEAVFEIEED